MVTCVKAWGITSPKVIVAHGATTTNNANPVAQGYFDILTPLFTVVTGLMTRRRCTCHHGGNMGIRRPPRLSSSRRLRLTQRPTRL